MMKCFTSRLAVVFCWFATLLVLPGLTPAQSADSPSASRKAWRYTGTGGTNTFLNVDGKKWIIYRGDGRTYLYVEDRRTRDYVELRGPTTKLWFRLGDGQGFLRKSPEEAWKPWTTGKWIDADPLTAFDKFGPTDYRLRLVYFVPQDRQPAKNYERKIAVVMSLVAELYENDLQAKGNPKAGLSFETEKDAPVVHLVRGKQPASYYNNAPKYDPVEQFTRIGRELLETQGDPERHLIVVFAETYEEGPAEEAWKGHIARGTANPPDGGLAVYSTWVLKDEFCALSVPEQRKLFLDATPIPGRKAFGSARGNSARFEFIEDGIGAVAHELGHALGLPHDYREPGVDVMGNGFRNIRWNFTSQAGGQRAKFSAENARLLMSSRYINPKLNLVDYDPPVIDIKLKQSPSKAVTAHVTMTDDSGLRAIVFYDRTGEKRSSVVAGRPLRGKEMSFEQSLPPSVAEAGEVEIEVFVTDDGGNVSRQVAKLGGSK
ncbi:MAG: hypothetical protein AABP62_17010 [Planctomycetota bacterium]